MENLSAEQITAAPSSSEVGNPVVSVTGHDTSAISDDSRQKVILNSPTSPVSPAVAPVYSNPEEDDPDYDPYNPYGKDYIFEV